MLPLVRLYLPRVPVHCRSHHVHHALLSFEQLFEAVGMR